MIGKILNFKTYSQYYEDIILYSVFNDIEKGFYIDIGANDPDILSVTKAFYLSGWKGMNIEPLSDKYNSLLKLRPRDINLQIGVGANKGNSTFYLSETGSTLHKNYISNISDSINIKIDTMSNVCKEHLKMGEIIHFCKIDVEGGEKDVLLGYDFINFRPNLFVIESTVPGTNIPSYSSWEYILVKNNYSFVYQYMINRFYVDNKFPEIKKKFLYIDNYIKLYEKSNKKNYFIFW